MRELLKIAGAIILLCSNASAKNFDLFGLALSEENGKKIQKGLIFGGFVDGILEGDSGFVYKVDKGDTTQFATITVEDANKYETLLAISRKIPTDKVNDYFISIEPHDYNQLDLPALAENCLEQKDYLKAAFLYVKQLQKLNCADSTISAKIDHCLALEKERRADFRKKELGKRTVKLGGVLEIDASNRNLYYEIATHYFSMARYGAAKEYFDKILDIDSTFVRPRKFIDLICKITGYMEEDFDLINIDDTGSTQIEYVCDYLPAPDQFVAVELQPEIIEMGRIHTPDLKKDGTVWVKSLVGSNGHVIRSEIAKTSGISNYDALALEASYRNSFTPAIVDQKPINAWISYKIEFEQHEKYKKKDGKK